jgi:mRNA (2'-O-methyladenosine-N6-)-methyltransferase
MEFYLLGPTTSISSNHAEYERDVLCILHETHPNLPITSAELLDQLRKNLNADVSHEDINKILEKLAAQDVIK